MTNNPLTSLSDFCRQMWSRLTLFWEVKIYEKILAKKTTARIYSLVFGHIYFETLRAAIRFDLFSLLSKYGCLTRSEVAQHLGIKEQPARILLLGLTTIGLIRKKK